jgi:hypothetical protein
MSKTCFVIMGFGAKKDPGGEEYNLDLTYAFFLKPLLEKEGVICFRGDEKNLSGNIDRAVIEWLLRADYVIADLTTANVNVMYELGIRYALRPKTTLLIADETFMKSKPFDIEHLVIHTYKHPQKGNLKSFKQTEDGLTNLILEMMDSEKTDSPVYEMFPSLTPPDRSAIDVSDPELIALQERADGAFSAHDYPEAIHAFRGLVDRHPYQRTWRIKLATAIFKNAPGESKALLEAQSLLLQEIKSNTGGDKALLNLLGEITMQLFELNRSDSSLARAIGFFQHSYLIEKDPFVGNSLAYLLDNQAAKKRIVRGRKPFEHLFAQHIRREVVQECETWFKVQALYPDRYSKEDKLRMQTYRAEANYGLGKITEGPALFIILKDSATPTIIKPEDFKTRLENLDRLMASMKPK